MIIFMKYISTFFLFCLCAVLGFAQDLPAGQIEVVKDFEVRLMETPKIRIVPYVTKHDTIVRNFTYELLAPSPSISYITPELKPLAMTAEKRSDSYPLFAKIGYGNPNAILGALSYDHMTGDQLFWGIDFRHERANNKKIPVQKYATSHGRLDGGYILDNGLQIDAHLDGSFESHYFYGADPIPQNTESLKRKFNRYEGAVQLTRHISPVNSLGYQLNLQYRYDKDDLGSKENTLRLGGQAASSLAQGELPIGIRAELDYTKFTHFEEYQLNNIILAPYVHYALGDLRIQLSGKALFVDDQKTEILPDIMLSTGLFEHRLTIRAGWESEVYKNNFHTISTLNPYIWTRLDSITNTVSRRIFAGATGKAGEFEFDLSGGYTKFNALALFLQYEFDPEQFEVLYDNGSFIGLEGSVKYEPLKYVTVRAAAWQRFYSLKNEDKPWHRPSFGLDAQTTYNGGGDTYHVSLLFHAENGLPWRTIGETEMRLDPLLDLNLHADYFITPNIGVFAEVNNMLNNKRERWVNYPRYGFHVMGGIVVRFL